MPQSLSNVLLHIVFSTKHRIEFITSEIENELYQYITAVCKSHQCHALDVGGTENHIHILCRLSRTVTISKLVEKIKTGSSRWIKTRGPQFQSFAWQKGYGAFSIGVSNIPALKYYIQKQKEHHKKGSYQEELRKIFKKYQVDYDDQYVWD